MTKEERKKYNKQYKEKSKLPFWIIYCLPNEDIPYAGMTQSPTYRMHAHKGKGRDTEDWFILDICMTEDEARRVEDLYHDQGYDGMGPSRSRKDKGKGSVCFVNYKQAFVANINVDGKQVRIKQSKNEQVCIDALNKFKEDPDKPPCRKGKGYVYFLNYKQVFVANIMVDGKRIHIKQSKNEQVCIDALNKFKEERDKISIN